MNNILDYSSEVRKNIINMLMFSLYSDERTIYREYVQNALDSINRAVRLHVLNQSKDGLVRIDINNKQRSIIIRDNGTGIQSADAVRILLDISSTTKDGIVEAGQFGIGRLVGGGYCHELVFITSAMGEGVATRITFDVDQIWKMVKEDETDYLATDVINRCTRREQILADEKEHFFEVQLNKVKQEYASVLLNSEEVINYLNVVAPVEYKSQFNNVLIYSSTEKNKHFRDLHEGLEKIQLFVGDTRIQKQYGLEIEGNKDKIYSLEYFKITDSNYGELGWGWFALTKYTVQIPKEDSLAGIRLRIHNIQIGDANLLSGKPLWPEDRGNSYFYGEVFATHPNIRPDSARNGLAPTSESKAFYAALGCYFKELKQLYTKANEAKKAIEKIYDGIQRLKTVGFGDYKGWDDIDNKGIAKFEQLDKKISFEPARRMLDLYRPSFLEAQEEVERMKEDKGKSVSKEKSKEPTDTRTVLGVRETVVAAKPVINHPDVLPTHPDVLPSSQLVKTLTSSYTYNPAEEGKKYNDDERDSEPKANSTQTKENEPTIQTVVETSSVVPTRLAPQDIIAPLVGILDKSEVWIIRRVFKVLNENCPNNDHDKRLIEELEQLIVKEFSNGN